MNIKSYRQFINEAKLHIYHTTFKVYDLMDRRIYKKSQIKKWMRMYDFDEFAHWDAMNDESKIPKYILEKSRSTIFLNNSIFNISTS